jgi:hypothetical protein
MDVATLWTEAYQGEVFGEAIFGGLAAREADPAHRRALEVLTALERSTKHLAEPLLARRGYEPGDTEASLQSGAAAVAALEAISWEAFVGSITPVADEFLAKYRRIVELTDDPADLEVAEAYVAHELALAAFARRELGQEEGDPLAPILALPHVSADPAPS